MLKIDFNVIPFGNYDNKYNIETLYIANVGGDRFKADYHIWFNDDPTDYVETERPTPHMVFKKYKREKGALELVRVILARLQSKDYTDPNLNSMKGLK